MGLTLMVPMRWCQCHRELKTLGVKRSNLLHLQTPTKMSISFSNPTEIFWAMACSGGDGFRAGDPCINPALLSPSAGDPALKTTVARVQLPPAVGPQSQLLTYEVSIEHRQVLHDLNQRTQDSESPPRNRTRRARNCPTHPLEGPRRS